MKESKEACGSSKAPKPNLKNPKFVNWSKAESCKQEDNIVSSEWKEKLKNIPPFLPAYGNKPVNMIYLLSGEYGRLWKKERDEWYGKVFVLSPKEKDMNQRRKKIRQEIKETRKAAEASIQERKERRAKEIEAKAKAEAEKYEKLRARVQKLKSSKLQQKAPKKSKEIKPELSPKTSEPKEDTGLNEPEKSSSQTVSQCECSDHNKKTNNEEPKPEPTATEKKETEPETNEKPEKETNQTAESDPSCVMCDGYIKQLEEVHEGKYNRKESNEEPKAQSEAEVKAE